MRLAKRRGDRQVRVYRETDDGPPQTAWADDRTPMPKLFCLVENYEESVGVLAKLRGGLSRSVAEQVPGIRGTRKGRVRNFLDFATMEICSLAAALVLASEYDRAKSVRPIGISLINLDKWHPSVVAFFDAIGFFDLLKISRPSVAPFETDWRILKFLTGEMVGNQEAGSLTRALAEIIQEVGPITGVDVPKLYAALIEATENTCWHAYPSDGTSFAVRRWWMTGAANPVNRKITIVVYDQGVSIPARLNQWKHYGWVEKALRRLLGIVPADEDHRYDMERMRFAMGAPLSSSSGLIHRGKGFPAFKDVVDQCKFGRLRIVSRRGEFIYETGQKPTGKVLQTPLPGTLIEWNLSL